MQAPLIATKLYLPGALAGLAPRPRLAERLDAALRVERAAVIVSAPAGYGKTTALVEWIRSRPPDGHPAAWLSLDEGDNDLARFCAYLAAAVRTRFPQVQTAPEAGADFSGPPEAALAPLVNALAGLPGPFLIVLDDYHLIDSPAVHAATTFLLERLPPQAHLVISGRADPPLPLARLRSRGQIVELHLADLRFTPAEAAALLERHLGVTLSGEDIAALTARTEGWAAGLQMAAISLQGRADPSEFIRQFTGSHRYVLDYLVEEALQRQPPEMQRFLMQTSILERLSGPLVEAVTGQPGGQARLEALERLNLFILPLDDRREWFRYHRLFADLLQSRLLQQPGVDPSPAELHTRAADWYAHNGLAEEAIEHTLAAGNSARAAELIDQAAEATLMRSELATFLGWMERLPPAERLSRPRLTIYRGWARLWSGASLDELREDLEAAGMEGSPAGGRLALDGFLALFGEQFTAAGRLSRHALQALPADRPLLRSLAAITEGLATISEGKTEAGMRLLEQTAQSSLQEGNVLAASIALNGLAQTWYKEGRLSRAEAVYRQSLEAATLPGGRRLPAAGLALSGLGVLALLHNRLEAARQYLTEAMQLSEGWGVLGSLGVHTDLVSLATLERDWPAAEAALEQARRVAQRFDLAAMDNLLVDMLEAQLNARRGRLAEAQRWLEARGLRANPAALEAERLDDPASSRVRKYEYLVAARILAANRQLEDALRIAEHLVSVMRRFDRLLLWLQACTLCAEIHAAAGRPEPALAALEAALQAAEPEQITVFFVSEGESLRPLLRTLRPRLKDARLAAFADRVLAEFSPPAPDSPPAAATLLSERELEVLRLVADGLSNREIADRLYVSVRTVKFHTGNVFGKLGATNRTQAVRRAREEGLLEV